MVVLRCRVSPLTNEVDESTSSYFGIKKRLIDKPFFFFRDDEPYVQYIYPNQVDQQEETIFGFRILSTMKVSTWGSLYVRLIPQLFLHLNISEQRALSIVLVTRHMDQKLGERERRAAVAERGFKGYRGDGGKRRR
jgi:hypothetical protein